jgi:signal transduction histidine kinase
MLNRIAKWYDAWEQEQLDVLADPGLADKLPPGYRRYGGQKLAKLSPIERQQLREFCSTYRGRRLWTALGKQVLAFSAAGLLINLIFPAKTSLSHALVLANLVGFTCVMALVSVWFNYRKIASNKLGVLLRMIGWTLVGILVGAAMSYGTGGQPLEVVLEKLPRTLALAGIGVGVLLATPMIIIGAFRNSHHEAMAVQLQLEAERERMARELSESQLRLLRAQIEPHFLFNTLGAVQQLAEHGAPQAASLTASLIAFLRASLTEMRSEQATLGAEFNLVEAYLQVMQPRLGARLRYSLSLPAELAAVSVPSMILLTLVENAIKHGIEPALRGGAVEVSARHIDGKVVICVRDTGAGMSPVPGAGVGLENVRHRLQLAHGDAASLRLDDGGDGVTAEILIPFQRVQKQA